MPALLAIDAVVDSVLPAATFTIEVFVSVVRPVKLPPVTSNLAAPVLVNVLSPVRLPATVNTPLTLFRIGPLTWPAALTVPEFVRPPLTTLAGVFVVSVPAFRIGVPDVSVPLLTMVEPTAFDTLPALTSVAAAMLTPAALVDWFVSAPVIVSLPADTSTCDVPVLSTAPVTATVPVVATLNRPAPLFVTLPVTFRPPLSTLLLPALAMMFVSLFSVAVPPGPLKLITPVALLLILPASITLPFVATLIVALLLSVLAVPCSVAPAPTAIVPAPLLLITPASSVLPAAMVTVPVFVSEVSWV